MELSEFKKYAKNIDEFQPSEIEDFTFMSDEELDEYQVELEKCSGNLSDWDHIRAFITLKYKIINSVGNEL